MFSISHGKVIKIIKDDPQLQEIQVETDNAAQPQAAYNYPQLYRRVGVGERVTLNTSAVKLGLGTGGRHFVVPEYEADRESQSKGHIMKLRYTPWQFPILALEEEAGPYHQLMETAASLDGVPVVAASLHSMVPGIILGFREKYRGDPRVVYIMTDGAALPIALSELVKELKRRQLLELTITAGNAFGGDLEAVGIPSALVAAKQAGKADLIIVSLGPGIAGTGTKLGFSGIEQSWVIDLTARLGGMAVTVPRISGADPRDRHYGLSHHTRTILSLATNPSALALSDRIPSGMLDRIIRLIHEDQSLQRNDWYYTDEPPAAELFDAAALVVKSMGRGPAEDPIYFQSTVAAGYLAAALTGCETAALRKAEVSKID